MQLHDLKPNKGAKHRKKRIGRGDGSGRGNYSGRGMKGQSSRSGGKRRPGFEGGQTPLHQRMPKLKGFKNHNRDVYQVVNLSDLDKFKDGDAVGMEQLLEMKIIRKKDVPVKLLGNGEVTKKVTVQVHKASKSAIEKAEKAGVKVELLLVEEKKAEKKEKAEEKK